MYNNEVCGYSGLPKDDLSEDLGIGTYSEAVAYAKKHNHRFQWVLTMDGDDDNTLHKTIWHVGDYKFIDCVGAPIEGAITGITVDTNGTGVLYLYPPDFDDTTSIAAPKTIDLVSGRTVLTTQDLIDLFGLQDYDGTSVGKVVSKGVGTAKYTEISIDMTGITTKAKSFSNVSYTDGVPAYTLCDTKLVSATNITLDVDYIGPRYSKSTNNISTSYTAFGNYANLKTLQLSGVCRKMFSHFMWYAGANSNYVIETLDLSGLFYGDTNNTCTIDLDCFCRLGTGTLSKVDLSNMDTSTNQSLNSFLWNTLSTGAEVIIGNFNTSNVTNFSSFMNGVYNCVLICTTNTPPTISSSLFFKVNTYHGIQYHFNEIVVPDGYVDAYKTAWNGFGVSDKIISSTEYLVKKTNQSYQMEEE